MNQVKFNTVGFLGDKSDLYKEGGIKVIKSRAADFVANLVGQITPERFISGGSEFTATIAFYSVNYLNENRLRKQSKEILNTLYIPGNHSINLNDLHGVPSLEEDYDQMLRVASNLVYVGCDKSRRYVEKAEKEFKLFGSNLIWVKARDTQLITDCDLIIGVSCKGVTTESSTGFALKEAVESGKAVLVLNPEKAIVEFYFNKSHYNHFLSGFDFSFMSDWKRIDS